MHAEFRLKQLRTFGYQYCNFVFFIGNDFHTYVTVDQNRFETDRIIKYARFLQTRRSRELVTHMPIELSKSCLM